MTHEPDYKTAYETLMRAVNEADRIIARAQIMTSVGLSLQRGEDPDPEVLKIIKELNEPSE